ncbi:hypothetical protein Tco_1094523 [Tanacetum coccineum]|uniref:Uncharacterized protein n=1 Tax=Tanacetum coccineum TaxID=301880 RepID=A0ABQ5IFS2_9ASTR
MKKPEAPKKEKTPPASESIKSGGGKQKKKIQESYMRQCRLQKRHNVLSFWPWATPSLLSRSLRADVYGSLFQQSERRSVPGHKSFVSECPLATDVQAMLGDSSNSRSAESTLKDMDLTSRAVLFVTCLTDSKTLEHYNIYHFPQRQIRGIPGDLSLGIGFPGDMSPGICQTEKLDGDTFPGDNAGPT